ncbi:MAG: L,D-transpeptidase [uncultured Sulfurovum sp.]|uniref:L,D-transpeptidase n=1 Tax=uncultured Sulfurovum sp. TaxID=269237 RepID=A0A6S6S6V8_9BACT|nr:MAG: L,D-transpeptidase [uncultured Sulfurovum sp.]
MYYLKLLLIFCVLLTTTSFAAVKDDNQSTVKVLTHEVIPLSKTTFRERDLITGQSSIVDLTDKSFIVVSVREKGSDGRFYAIDRDGTVWWSGTITSGTMEYRTPSGIFRIFQKKRYHMSKEFPSDDGINNMDYMMKFTLNGHALHKGSVGWLSHGCIHIDPKDVPIIYNWSDHKTKVVITRQSYMPFARNDLKRIYLK